MRTLPDIREEIDRIDKEIVKLFQERMDCSKEVAEYKKATNTAIYDRKREEEKKVALCDYVEDEYIKKTVSELFSQIMSLSRKYQYHNLEQRDRYIENYFQRVPKLEMYDDTRVVHQGVPGAYSQKALLQFFGEGIDHYHVKTFKEVALALNNGDADYGVLPIENSSAGNVDGIYDILLENDVCIVGEEIIKIDHALLGVPGSKLEDIKVVYSHPQALMQCKKYLAKSSAKKISLNNTAEAAKKVKEDGDKTQAAIAGEWVADMYGLDILDKKLNHEENNSTRFVIISKKRQYTEDAQKISISFALPHETGTLYNILSHFIFNDLSMTNIESVPLPNRQWEYRFFIDLTGNLNSSSVKNALKGIREEVTDFKILGNY